VSASPERTRNTRYVPGAEAPRSPSLSHVASRWMKEDVVTGLLVPVLNPLLEPILHPSRWRVRALALTTSVGHPLFYVLWTAWLPQPYENLWLRLVMSILGFSLLVFPGLTATPPSQVAAATFTAIFCITLPWFFSWMYLCNHGNTVWLASLGAMFLIYYQLTDWRLATLGAASGLLGAWVIFRAVGPPVPEMGFEQLATNTAVIAFCWFMALVLGVSSSNLRREQLNFTLATMGIMAHELRTPLATMALIGDAVRGAATECSDTHSRAKLEQLAMRLHTLVRNMNHQIDTQIANARITRLPSRRETVSAGELVASAVANYPFRSTREKECVHVKVQDDFVFQGSHALFSQVIDNLVKNALRSLAAASNATQPGDIAIDIDVRQDRGRIVVADRGIGIDAESQPRIFEPFFSTNHGTGHGLGLAFCYQVVLAARGSIRVKSQPRQGAVFTIELPVSRRA
jgi:two-component system, CAI-1 autoinducer sensor kinase/phosphatase CqsS